MLDDRGIGGLLCVALDEPETQGFLPGRFAHGGWSIRGRVYGRLGYYGSGHSDAAELSQRAVDGGGKHEFRRSSNSHVIPYPVACELRVSRPVWHSQLTLHLHHDSGTPASRPLTYFYPIYTYHGTSLAQGIPCLYFCWGRISDSYPNTGHHSGR